MKMLDYKRQAKKVHGGMGGQCATSALSAADDLIVRMLRHAALHEDHQVGATDGDSLTVSFLF